MFYLIRMFSLYRTRTHCQCISSRLTWYPSISTWTGATPVCKHFDHSCHTRTALDVHPSMTTARHNPLHKTTNISLTLGLSTATLIVSSLSLYYNTGDQSGGIPSAQTSAKQPQTDAPTNCHNRPTNPTIRPSHSCTFWWRSPPNIVTTVRHHRSCPRCTQTVRQKSPWTFHETVWTCHSKWRNLSDGWPSAWNSLSESLCWRCHSRGTHRWPTKWYAAAW